MLSNNRHICPTLHQNKYVAMVTKDGNCLGSNNIAICNICLNATEKWFAQKVAALETPHLKEDPKTEILVRHYELMSLK